MVRLLTLVKNFIFKSLFSKRENYSTYVFLYLWVRVRDKEKLEKRRWPGHFYNFLLLFFSSISSHQPLPLNKKADANTCNMLKDWIRSFSFSFAHSHSFGPFFSFFSFEEAYSPPPPLHPHSLPLFSPPFWNWRCVEAWALGPVYFGAVIKFIAWHTNSLHLSLFSLSNTTTHTYTFTHSWTGESNNSIGFFSCIMFKPSLIFAAFQIFVTAQQWAVYNDSKQSIQCITSPLQSGGQGGVYEKCWHIQSILLFM